MPVRILLLLLISLHPLRADPPGPPPPPSPALVRLGRALTYRTTAGAEGSEAFAAFHAFLREAFPLVHSRLARLTFGHSTLLFRWSGTRPDLRPVLLAAHQDVAAVEAGTETQWHQAPFAGTRAAGFIWGRGARDFKPGLMAILESVEGLLQRGFVPERDIYLAFGDDEESQGYGGAARIAAYLAAAKVQLECVLDEGGTILQGTLDGLDPNRPVAIVCVAEKGYLSVDLQVEGRGGHAAVPTGDNPILVLGKALERLDRRPFPATLQEPVTSMLEELAPSMNSWRRWALAHPRLVGWALRRVLARNTEFNAMLRNTLAITRFSSGAQDNVLPPQARAVLNLRLLPGWTVEQAMTYLREVIDDPRVHIRIRGRASQAPPVAPTDSSSYRLLSGVIRDTFPGALVVPSLLNGTTDSRHYAPLTRNLYRFAPSVNTRSFSGNGHGIDERLPVANYGQYLAFYTTFIQASASGRH